MNTRTFAGSLVAGIILASSTGLAEERHHYERLDPALGPCLMEMDENGNDTTVVLNAPCDLGGTVYNPGDPISQAQVEAGAIDQAEEAVNEVVDEVQDAANDGAVARPGRGSARRTDRSR